MTAWLLVALTLVIAYLLGSIPTGYLFAKWLKGIDIRQVGSGSTGATNVLRTLGKKAGATVLAIDVLKGVLAVCAVYGLYKWLAQTTCQLDDASWQAINEATSAFNAGQGVNATFPEPQMQCLKLSLAAPWVVVGAGLLAILGHSKSVWLGFTGGKSVATSLGVLLAMSPIVGLSAFGVFLISIALTKIVSISSIAAALGAMILMLVFQQPIAYCLLAIAGGIYVIWRHRSNIQRLLAGTEPKIGQKTNDNAETST
ncbi:glycerol-3-phosphate 1-O-acyltransferase PlsY [Alkalinema sp. FACHB-956]|uniref:glycerol-3-phosphate 1-O-acyltransferase PlsY n=1 Tax=Alkalinema sp. FACHB-956 TaxID=2692768 RepID=UPI0016869F3B|nr:glycerol-3-phosphate 1-O-acyltransferase PlsY [Alkalinema sp. FACHB-956]MBD2327475.1 glycerol-3-phosphate 1-O-acyltransferase PlsY [Alkalinema sp. FACHB-956]